MTGAVAYCPAQDRGQAVHAGADQRPLPGGLLQAQLLLLENYLLERGLILRRPANPLLGECRGPAC